MQKKRRSGFPAASLANVEGENTEKVNSMQMIFKSRIDRFFHNATKKWMTKAKN